jgi:predicted transcriptional regulator
MKTNYEKDLENRLKNAEFKKEYEALELEYVIIQAIIDARKSMHLTQKQLSELTGVDQADISKIETGMGNPTLKMLGRLLRGMNLRMKLESISNEVHEE